MAGTIVNNPVVQFFDNNGNPLAGGKITTYLSNTVTPAATYQNEALSVLNTNPIILNSRGEATIWLTPDVQYTFVLTDADDTLIQTVNDIYGAFQAGSNTIDAAQVSYTPAGTGAVATTVEAQLQFIQQQVVNVKDAPFYAIGDGVTDDTAAMAAALAAVPVGGVLFFPAGVYRGYLLVWRGDISIVGEGSSSSKIKLPDSVPSITVPWEPGGTVTGVPSVIEIGECALGNIANPYENVTVRGLKLDGNFSNNVAPTIDLFGHGMILTKISNYTIEDVVAENCFLTGIDCVINSNYGSVQATVSDCGNASIGGAFYPNFDVNSSKFSTFNVTSNGGQYSGRMLDNCWGNTITVRGFNPSITGFVYGNQAVNESYSNIIDVTIVDGCVTGQGVSVGDNCFSSEITATISNATGIGVFVNGTTEPTQPRGNKINVRTTKCGSSSVFAGGFHNEYEITSRQDGDAGPAGSAFAVDINGSYNQFIINVEDASTPQVRGVVFRLGAESNTIIDYVRNTTVQDFLNQDTSNTNVWYFQYATGLANKWQTATLNAGWSNNLGAPYPVVQYYKDINGVVRIKGNVNGGAGVIFNLPAGFRPVDSLIFPTVANGAVGRLQVDAAGDVTLLVGTATNVDLTPMQFAIF